MLNDLLDRINAVSEVLFERKEKFKAARLDRSIKFSDDFYTDTEWVYYLKLDRMYINLIDKFEYGSEESNNELGHAKNE